MERLKITIYTCMKLSKDKKITVHQLRFGSTFAIQCDLNVCSNWSNDSCQLNGFTWRRNKLLSGLGQFCILKETLSVPSVP